MISFKDNQVHRHTRGAAELQNISDRWTNTQISIFVGTLTGVALLPELLVRIPAMTDYPNHLARMYILAAAAAGKTNHFYQVEWGVYPNLAMDLFVPKMARLTNVHIASKMFLILSELLVIGGASFLEFAVKRRLEFASLFALLFLYGAPLAIGLVNFEFSIGIAFVAIACWILLAQSPWYLRFIVHTCFVCLLFFAEAFGLGLYGLTIGLYELGKNHVTREGFAKLAATFILMAIPVIAILWFGSQDLTSVAVGTISWSIFSKFASIGLLINYYNPWVSLSIVLLFGIGVFYLWQRKMVFLPIEGRWIAVGFLICFIVLPFRIFNPSSVDFRFPAVALPILAAFTTISLSAWWRNWIPVVIAAVIGVNIAYVSWIWVRYDRAYAEIVASFRLLEKNSRVLVGLSGNRPRANDLPLVHVPTLATHYAEALVPTLFAFPGIQPVRLRPEFNHFRIFRTGFSEPVPLPILERMTTNAAQKNIPEFIRCWPKYYDYLYLIGPYIHRPIPGILEKIGSGTSFVLYRIHSKANC